MWTGVRNRDDSEKNQVIPTVKNSLRAAGGHAAIVADLAGTVLLDAHGAVTRYDAFDSMTSFASFDSTKAEL